jgi:hypothetical protein
MVIGNGVLMSGYRIYPPHGLTEEQWAGAEYWTDNGLPLIVWGDEAKITTLEEWDIINSRIPYTNSHHWDCVSGPWGYTGDQKKPCPFNK